MQIILYLGIDLLGCFALFLVSCFFVGKVLKPVEESQKRQNEFIAAASHDLRTPLAVIQTNASALLIEGVDNQRFVPKIKAECRRMSRLISDMLILASSDAKTWQIQKEDINTESYLIDLYDTFYELCRKKNHVLKLDLPEENLPVIHSDKGRLTQIIGILIDNAVCYSPEESSITLSPYIRRSSFCLEVEDHGCGISKEQKEKIFNRFYCVDKSRNDNTHFGLGLSVAKELIELHGAKIYVKDTEGGGATFLLEIPL
jgi:signal transduction histidine kinase